VHVVYIPSWDGNLYALRAENGRRLWSFTMKPQPGSSYPQASSPAVEWLNGRRVVYVGGGMTMYCIDAVTGELIWEFDAGTGCTDCRFDPNDPGRRERNEILSSPAVFEGRVYFGMDVDDGRGKGGVYAVRADDGRLVWFLNMTDVQTCRPFPEDNVRRFDGYHSAAALGLPNDFFATRPGCDFDRVPNECGNVWSSAAIDARRRLLYIASSNCDTDDNPNTPRPAPPMPPLDEAIFALTLDGELAWVWRPREVDNADLAFGATPNLFEIQIGGRAREVVGIGNKDGTYYLLDRDGVNEITGNLEPYWQRTVFCDGAPCSGPFGGIIGSAAVGEERVFFSTAIGFSLGMLQLPAAHALDARDGSILWENHDQLPSFAPTVGVPGVVFMGELATGRVHVYHSANGAELAVLDARGAVGGVAAAPAVVAGELYVGGGTGTRGGLPGPELFSSSFDTPLTAFCVAGTPGCPDQPPCDDGNPCTYDFRENGECESEPAPDTLSCAVEEEAGRCQDGTCVVREPCDDDNPCTQDFYEDITCVRIPVLNGTECSTDVIEAGVCQAGECVAEPEE
jgi:outer membrane protein assembly factor BamB